MLMDIIIRTERPEDRSRVFELVKAAFADVSESDHTEHLLVERLRLCEAFVPDLSLVAVSSDGTVVGHVLMTRVEIVGSGMKSWSSLALAPLSVLPSCQRQGIGGRLLVEAHRRAAELGHKSVVLLGHESYYPRFGYRRASGFGIRFPFDAPDECCLAVELVLGGLSGVDGMVRYPEAFGL